jgi:actin-related protein 10
MDMAMQITQHVPDGYQIPVELHPLTSLDNGTWSNECLVDVEARIKMVVHQVYFKHLMVDPTVRKLLVVRKTTWPRVFEDLIRKVVQSFKVPAVDFMESNVLSMLSAGKTNGLVVDVGWNETTVVPVFDSRPLKAVTVPVGALHVCRHLQTLLGTSYKLAQLDDIKARICFANSPSANESTDEWNLDGVSVSASVRWKALEPLFRSDDLEVSTIPQAIATCLLQLPLDLRKPMANSIHLVGGTCMLPGVRTRILEELERLFSQSTYNTLSRLPLSMVSSPFAPHIAPWLGGSLAAVLKAESTSNFDQ